MKRLGLLFVFSLLALTGYSTSFIVGVKTSGKYDLKAKSYYIVQQDEQSDNNCSSYLEKCFSLHGSNFPRNSMLVIVSTSNRSEVDMLPPFASYLMINKFGHCYKKWENFRQPLQDSDFLSFIDYAHSLSQWLGSLWKQLDANELKEYEKNLLF